MPRIALLLGHTAYIDGYLRDVGRPSGPRTFLDANGAVRRVACGRGCERRTRGKGAVLPPRSSADLLRMSRKRNTRREGVCPLSCAEGNSAGIPPLFEARS